MISDIYNSKVDSTLPVWACMAHSKFIVR